MAIGHKLTDNHDVEVESLADRLAVPLVWKVGKTNVSGELSANNVAHVTCLLSSNLWVGGSDALWHLHWRSWFSIWHRRRW